VPAMVKAVASGAASPQPRVLMLPVKYPAGCGSGSHQYHTHPLWWGRSSGTLPSVLGVKDSVPSCSAADQAPVSTRASTSPDQWHTYGPTLAVTSPDRPEAK
jgi:hypothetical protein